MLRWYRLTLTGTIPEGTSAAWAPPAFTVSVNATGRFASVADGPNKRRLPFRWLNVLFMLIWLLLVGLLNTGCAAEGCWFEGDGFIIYVNGGEMHDSSLLTGTGAPAKLSDVLGTSELFTMDAEKPLPAQGWWTSAGWTVEVMSGQNWIQAPSVTLCHRERPVASKKILKIKINKQKFQFPWNYVKWNADNLFYSHFTTSNLSVFVFV